MSRYPWINLPARAYVYILRGTPVLLQLIILYNVLPQFGLRLSPFLSAMLALMINETAFCSEIIRGGITAVDRHHDCFSERPASPQKEGSSGLGIEAQRAAIARFIEVEGCEMIGEHAEVETGKGADALDRRPELARALAAPARPGAPSWWRSWTA